MSKQAAGDICPCSTPGSTHDVAMHRTAEKAYTDPRCGCSTNDGLHEVTCRFWPLFIQRPDVSTSPDQR